MTSSPLATPSYLSAAAQEFIKHSVGDWSKSDLSLGSKEIEELRNENRSVGLGYHEVIAANFPVEVQKEVFKAENVTEVPVSWVFPKNRRETREELNVVAVYAFGGASVLGGADDDLHMTSMLAHFLDMPICVVHYRLAPEHPFSKKQPCARSDMKVAFSALHNRANINKILVIGESFGGHLALCVVLDTLSTMSLVQSKIAGLALFSPWIDLSHSGDSHLIGEKFNLDPTLSVDAFLGPAAVAYASGDEQYDLKSPEISPLFRNDYPQQFPPCYISTATRDLLLSDSTRLNTKLRQVCGPKAEIVLEVADSLWHVFEWTSTLPEARKSLQSAAEFLLSHSNCQ